MRLSDKKSFNRKRNIVIGGPLGSPWPKAEKKKKHLYLSPFINKVIRKRVNRSPNSSRITLHRVLFGYVTIICLELPTKNDNIP